MNTSFKELRVWQVAMTLTDEVYILTRKLPKEETYALSDQIRRAVVSIPSNIAEGQRRHTIKDFVKFLSIADGSCAELETQILIAIRQGMIDEQDAVTSLDLCASVGRMIYNLTEKLISIDKQKSI